MLLGLFSPLRLTRAFRLRAARKRYRRRPGPKEAANLAKLLADTGDRPGALEVLGKARSSYPRAAELKTLHDKVWANAAAAEIGALERTARSGARVEEFARLIELHRSLGNFDRCLAVAREAEEKHARSWILQLAVGKALYHRFLARRSRDDGGKAAECLREAVRLKPDCARALLYLAALLAELGLSDQALAAAEELVRVAPGNERALHLRDRLSRIVASRGPVRRGAAPRTQIACDPEIIAAMAEKLRSDPAVYGALVFGPDGAILHRHVVPNDHFAMEGRDGAILALAKMARGAAERMGIGRLHTCAIEGNPWQIYFGEVGGGILAVLAGKGYDSGEFENIVTRFSADIVNR